VKAPIIEKLLTGHVDTEGPLFATFHLNGFAPEESESFCAFAGNKSELAELGTMRGSALGLGIS